MHLQALRVKRLQSQLLLKLAANVHHEVRGLDGKWDRGEAEILCGRQVRLLPGDVTVLDHQPEHNLLACSGG